MNGRRLNPLKNEDVKMVINPRSKGTFIVKPRVLYINETVKYRSHELEPATITVMELGIRGWIEGRDRPPIFAILHFSGLKEATCAHACFLSQTRLPYCATCARITAGIGKS